MAGVESYSLTPSYAAGKTAVVGLVESLAHLADSDQIYVNAMCPGYVATNMVVGGLLNKDSPIYSMGQDLVDASGGLVSMEVCEVNGIASLTSTVLMTAIRIVVCACIRKSWCVPQSPCQNLASILGGPDLPSMHP